MTPAYDKCATINVPDSNNKQLTQHVQNSTRSKTIEILTKKIVKKAPKDLQTI